MNLEEIVTRFRAEGFEYLSTAEATNFINDAYLLDICEEEDWPWLGGTATGSAPLLIEDLRAIEYVVDSTQRLELRPLDRRNLVSSINTDLTTEGTPTFYYLTGGNTVNVFPTCTTDTLLVLYWKAPAPLAGTDTPLLPARFHSLIVDGAVARAYENSDDFELRDAKQTLFQNRLLRMKESLGDQHRDGPESYIEVTDPESWV